MLPAAAASSKYVLARMGTPHLFSACILRGLLVVASAMPFVIFVGYTTSCTPLATLAARWGVFGRLWLPAVALCMQYDLRTRTGQTLGKHRLGIIPSRKNSAEIITLSAVALHRWVLTRVLQLVPQFVDV